MKENHCIGIFRIGAAKFKIDFSIKSAKNMGESNQMVVLLTE